MGDDRKRTCLVTGSASGIGAATPSMLVAAGWRVVGLDLVDDGPHGVEREVGDAADPETLTAALARAAGHEGRLDGLVCAAGIPPSGPWDDPTHWEQVVAVDLTAAYQAARLAMPALEAARGGIVFIGSIVGGAEGSSRSPGLRRRQGRPRGSCSIARGHRWPGWRARQRGRPGPDRHPVRHRRLPRPTPGRTCRSAGWAARTRSPGWSASCFPGRRPTSMERSGAWTAGARHCRPPRPRAAQGRLMADATQNGRRQGRAVASALPPHGLRERVADDLPRRRGPAGRRRRHLRGRAPCQRRRRRSGHGRTGTALPSSASGATRSTASPGRSRRAACPREESPLDGAQRELREETGLSAAEWREIGVVHVSNSVTDEVAHLFLATTSPRAPPSSRARRT